jgi:hypothetical protein
MKDGRCPKCNSNTVYTKPRGISYGSSSGVYIYIAGEWATKPTTQVDHYLCTTCGYFEAYVEDRARLEAVTRARDWKKVG